MSVFLFIKKKTLFLIYFRLKIQQPPRTRQAASVFLALHCVYTESSSNTLAEQQQLSYYVARVDSWIKKI